MPDVRNGLLKRDRVLEDPSEASAIEVPEVVFRPYLRQGVIGSLANRLTGSGIWIPSIGNSWGVNLIVRE